MITWNANWIFDGFWADDYRLIRTTAIGRPSHSWTGNSRFWPLGLCDYCIAIDSIWNNGNRAFFVQLRNYVRGKYVDFQQQRCDLFGYNN